MKKLCKVPVLATVCLGLIALAFCDLNKINRKLEDIKSDLTKSDLTKSDHTKSYLRDDLRDEKLYPAPDRLEAENSIRNGTFDWSKSPTSVLFLKKHKCARNHVYTCKDLAN